MCLPPGPWAAHRQLHRQRCTHRLLFGHLMLCLACSVLLKQPNSLLTGACGHHGSKVADKCHLRHGDGSRRRPAGGGGSCRRLVQANLQTRSWCRKLRDSIWCSPYAPIALRALRESRPQTPSSRGLSAATCSAPLYFGNGVRVHHGAPRQAGGAAAARRRQPRAPQPRHRLVAHWRSPPGRADHDVASAGAPA